jgi:hypothetical protein
VLSGLAVCAALTALVAGITGAWSPCGFSMVETIGSALGDARRGATLLASATFALGTVLGGVVTFGGLALLGTLAGHGFTGLREGLGAGLALAAAIADWRGVKIAPQIRRQVPERWRWTLPLPLACALYGILLGLGFTTFVLAFAVWALAGISFAAGDPLLGVAVGVAFGAGRALPVLWMAPGLRGGHGARRLDEMAVEPRLWLGLRRLDALGLGLCALALAGASASAATRVHGAGEMSLRPAEARPHALGEARLRSMTRVSSATDPSTAGDALAWQQIGGEGELSFAGATRAIPGAHPALGGATIAWATTTGIVVADRTTLAPKLTLAVTGVSALAVSDGWLVYRDEDTQGAESLIGVSLTAPAQRHYIFGARLAGEIGRPALDGARVVFTVDTPARSALELLDLQSAAAPRVLQAASRDALLLNPSLLGGELLFERVTRCAQQLLLGASSGRGHSHALLSLPSTVARDHGYQPGFTHAYNTASLCANRSAGRGGVERLGPTALGPTAAYVTEIGVVASDARILDVRR